MNRRRSCCERSATSLTPADEILPRNTHARLTPSEGNRSAGSAIQRSTASPQACVPAKSPSFCKSILVSRISCLQHVVHHDKCDVECNSWGFARVPGRVEPLSQVRHTSGHLCSPRSPFLHLRRQLAVNRVGFLLWRSVPTLARHLSAPRAAAVITTHPPAKRNEKETHGSPDPSRYGPEHSGRLAA